MTLWVDSKYYTLITDHLIFSRGSLKPFIEAAGIYATSNKKKAYFYTAVSTSACVLTQNL